MTKTRSVQPLTIFQGDCLDVLRMMPSNSVDSVVTDPPYGLSQHKPKDVVACLTAWLQGREYLTKKKGFMGRSWDSWVPGPEVWREVYRVLKPGGYLVACAGSRTDDLMGIAIRLAGFEIRDGLAWIYGSGFPKNQDASKAIDLDAFRDFLADVRPKALKHAERVWKATESDRWGWRWCKAMERRTGLALPGKRKVVGLAPQSGAKFKLTAETIDNGGFNDPDRTHYEITAPATPEAAEWEGWGTALKPAIEPMVFARKPFKSNLAKNLKRYRTGAINVAACRIGDEVLPAQRAGQAQVGTFEREEMVTPERVGRWPSNVLFSHGPECHRDDQGNVYCGEGCPVVELDRQSGHLKSGKPGRHRLGVNTGSAFGAESRPPGTPMTGHGDEGGASRFFKLIPPARNFFYVAKPSKGERNAGLEDLETKTPGQCTDRKDGSAGLKSPRSGAGRTSGGKNVHPTVKPIKLGRYLCRLITPPGGVVLDPFMGSGSFGCAARLEGFPFIGIERELEYVEISMKRIYYWSKEAKAYVREETRLIPQAEDGQDDEQGEALDHGEQGPREACDAANDRRTAEAQ